MKNRKGLIIAIVVVLIIAGFNIVKAVKLKMAGALLISKDGGFLQFSSDGSKMAYREGDKVSFFNLRTLKKMDNAPEIVDYLFLSSPDFTKYMDMPRYNGSNKNATCSIFTLEQKPKKIGSLPNSLLYPPKGDELVPYKWVTDDKIILRTKYKDNQYQYSISKNKTTLIPKGMTIYTDGTLGKNDNELLEAAHSIMKTKNIIIYGFVNSSSNKFFICQGEKPGTDDIDFYFFLRSNPRKVVTISHDRVVTPGMKSIVKNKFIDSFSPNFDYAVLRNNTRIGNDFVIYEGHNLLYLIKVPDDIRKKFADMNTDKFWESVN